jgi:hypothetical protein
MRGCSHGWGDLPPGWESRACTCAHGTGFVDGSSLSDAAARRHRGSVVGGAGLAPRRPRGARGRCRSSASACVGTAGAPHDRAGGCGFAPCARATAGADDRPRARRDGRDPVELHPGLGHRCVGNSAFARSLSGIVGERRCTRPGARRAGAGEWHRRYGGQRSAGSRCPPREEGASLDAQRPGPGELRALASLDGHARRAAPAPRVSVGARAGRAFVSGALQPCVTRRFERASRHGRARPSVAGAPIRLR